MNYKSFGSVLLLAMIISYGCSDSESTPGLGFIPKIRVVNIYNINDPENPTFASTFRIGDAAGFVIRIEDIDLDLKTLEGTEYLTESETLLNGPDEVPLEEQTSQIMTYRLIFPITISGPVGEHRMDFVAVDARGNESYINSRVFTVDE